MAAAAQKGENPLTSLEIISFLKSYQGSLLTNHDLVRHFRRQLKHSEANKQLLKDVSAKVATVRMVDGQKTIELRSGHLVHSAETIDSIYRALSRPRERKISNEEPLKFLHRLLSSDNIEELARSDQGDAYKIVSDVLKGNNEIDEPPPPPLPVKKSHREDPEPPPPHPRRNPANVRPPLPAKTRQKKHSREATERTLEENTNNLTEKPPRLPPKRSRPLAAPEWLKHPPPIKIPEREDALAHGDEDEEERSDDGRVAQNASDLPEKNDRTYDRRKAFKKKEFEKVDDSESDSDACKDRRKTFKLRSGGKSVKDLARDFNDIASTSQLQLSDHVRSRLEASRQKRLTSSNLQQEDEFSPLSADERSWLRAASANDLHAMLKLWSIVPLATRDRYSGYNALHWAAKHGNVTLIQKLLEGGDLNANRRTKGGYTPLMLAASCGRMAAYTWLVNNSLVDAELRDYAGKKAKDYLKEHEDDLDATAKDDADDESHEADGKRMRMRKKVEKSSTFFKGVVRDSFQRPRQKVNKEVQ